MEMGTEILLARMKDHPEEFINIDNRALRLDELRWDRVLRDAREHLPKEDVEALEAGMKQLYIDRFNERVLKVLAGESEPEQPEGTITYKTKGRYTTGLPVDAHEEYMKQKQYEMDQMRRQMNNAQNTLGEGISSFKNFFGRAD